MVPLPLKGKAYLPLRAIPTSRLVGDPSGVDCETRRGREKSYTLTNLILYALPPERAKPFSVIFILHIGVVYVFSAKS